MRQRHEQLGVSPLDEAVLEVLVEGAVPYSLIPGAVAAALGDAYSVVELPAARVFGAIPPPVEAGMVPMHRFQSGDGSEYIQLGHGGLTVNSRSYTTFEEFEPRIRHAVAAYFKVAHVTKVRRLGLRYVNLIVGGGVHFPQFTSHFAWPEVGGGAVEQVAARAVYAFQDPPGQLGVAVQFPAPKGTLLDLDFFAMPQRPMTLDEVMGWTEAAHERTYDAFRAMVKSDVYDSWLPKH